MAGKPCISITARRKDAPKGERSMVKLAGAWEGRFPGSYDVKLEGVREIVMNDGTVITGADYWLTLKDWREDDRGRRGGGSSKAEPGTGTPSGSSDDVPFRAPPRPAKDLS